MIIRGNANDFLRVCTGFFEGNDTDVAGESGLGVAMVEFEGLVPTSWYGPVSAVDFQDMSSLRRTVDDGIREMSAKPGSSVSNDKEPNGPECEDSSESESLRWKSVTWSICFNGSLVAFTTDVSRSARHLSGLLRVVDAPWAACRPTSPEILSFASGVPVFTSSGSCMELFGHAPGKNGVEDLRFGNRQRKGEADMCLRRMMVVKVKQEGQARLRGRARFLARCGRFELLDEEDGSLTVAYLGQSSKNALRQKAKDGCEDSGISGLG